MYTSLTILTNLIILIHNFSHVEFVFVALTDAIGPQQFFCKLSALAVHVYNVALSDVHHGTNVMYYGYY